MLFNEAAYVARKVQTLKDRATREAVAVDIGNRYSLVDKNGSCVRCGVMRAIEALQTSSSSPVGGTVVLVSQGVTTSLALNEEKELLKLAAKHRITVHAIAVPERPRNDVSLSLERLAHNTGGQSFFVPAPGADDDGGLGTYVGIVDALREVQARTTGDGPYLVRHLSFSFCFCFIGIS